MRNENSIVGAERPPSVSKPDAFGSVDNAPTGINLYDYFADVQVVHLEKFPERWDRFDKRAAKAGVSGYNKFAAVLGDEALPPVWWRSGNGAWGCLMSHLHIVQNFLTKHEGKDGHLLIFEDDALFSDNFAQRLPKVLAEVGDDWDMLYLGGQHLHLNTSKPWRCKTDVEVVNAYNVNRTHAFAVNRRFAVKFQQHIIHAPDYINYNFHAHIDHQLGVLHERGQHKIYAVDPWINGQAAGKSWTSGKETKDEWWQLSPKQILRR